MSVPLPPPSLTVAATSLPVSSAVRPEGSDVGRFSLPFSGSTLLSPIAEQGELSMSSASPNTFNTSLQPGQFSSVEGRSLAFLLASTASPSLDTSGRLSNGPPALSVTQQPTLQAKSHSAVVAASSAAMVSSALSSSTSSSSAPASPARSHSVPPKATAFQPVVFSPPRAAPIVPLIGSFTDLGSLASLARHLVRGRVCDSCPRTGDFCHHYRPTCITAC